MSAPQDEVCDAKEALQAVILWTTRDGREIPVDEMSDAHVANALRALKLWRARLKVRGVDEGLVALNHAIDLFKRLQRGRTKLNKRVIPVRASTPRLLQSASAFGVRRRKPVANT